MKQKNKKERTTPITRLIAGMSVWNTFLLVLAVLVISGIFFFKQVTSVYDEMDKAIVGEAATQMDPERVDALATECMRIYESIEDPQKLYDEDLDAYYTAFAGLLEQPGYAELQAMLNTQRQATQATEIDLVIFFPREEKGIYIMDARDVTAVPCGELFEVAEKYFDKDTLAFKGFYSKSRYFGTLRTNGVPLHIDKESGRSIYLTADIPTTVINDRVKLFVVNITVFSLLMCALITVIVVALLRRQVVQPIQEISDLAGSFVAGYESRAEASAESNIFQNIDGGHINEVRTLLGSMQSMEQKMNTYLAELKTVTAEKERIGTELALATRIQADMLPNIFPAFPERPDFDIYASMDPAKEVGGDFYDFFLIDETHLGLVMADVSGKGVPAALFMMVSKILVQNYALTGRSPAEVLQAVNAQICSNNREEMFVTVWFGILDTETGKITAANAGHEYPVLLQAGGRFELVKDKHGLVIGAMDGIRYKEYELTLTPGSKLFLYTDGVPEATDANNELFGLERMLAALNQEPNAAPETILKNVRAAVDDFVQEAEQFDDLTMLCLEYKGEPNLTENCKEWRAPAELEKLPELIAFLEQQLEAAECPPKTQMQISVAAEEIFVNIVNYAYAPGTGIATVRMSCGGDPATATITFIDSGVPFDPLKKEDPNVTLSAEDREIGGLGIYMTKKTMDDVRYEYKDGQNRLTLVKKL